MKKVVIKALALTCLASSLFAGTSFASGTIEFTNSTTLNSTYNRAEAVSFIKSYAASPGYTTSPYTTYGSLSDGGDCTNFASQILRIGGGLSFHGTSGYNRNTVDWYYYGPNVPPYDGASGSYRTSSWAGAHQFREHWGVINGVGGKKDYQMIKYTNQDAVASYNEIYAALWNGDIIQYIDSTGHTYHSQIVWNYANGTMNVAQHSVTAGYWGLDMGLLTQLTNRQYDGGWVVIHKIKYAST